MLNGFSKFEDMYVIRKAQYCIDVGLNYLQKWLDDQAKDCKDFELNPDFQRGYVWTKKQQIAYMEAYFQNPYINRDLFFNYPGYFGYSEELGFNDILYDKFVCVDGLQRLTAVLAFVNCELPIFGKTRDKYTNKSLLGWTMKMHINDLNTKREVLKWYLCINTGGTVHTDEDLKKVRKLLEIEGE